MSRQPSNQRNDLPADRAGCNAGGNERKEATVTGIGVSNTENEIVGVESATPLTPDLQGHIGRKLRSTYAELVNEPIPDRFTKLLEELARKQSDRE